MSSGSEPAGESSDEIKQRHRGVAAGVLPEHGQLYIGGEWVDSTSGDTFPTRDPTTGEVLAEVPAGTAGDVDRAVEAARRAYEEKWSDRSPGGRQRVLADIVRRVEANQETLAKLETLDTGKTLTEATGDMGLVVDHLTYNAALARSVTGETIPTDDLFDRDKQVFTLREPYGVVGAIVPWNFPLVIAIWKLGPALSAGNTLVLKPSEETPLSILKLLELVEDVVPDGVVNVVTGYGEDAGAPLSGHEDVDKVSFTGSTEVRKEIMRTAVETAMMAIFFNKGENAVRRDRGSSSTRTSKTSSSARSRRLRARCVSAIRSLRRPTSGPRSRRRRSSGQPST